MASCFCKPKAFRQSSTEAGQKGGPLNDALVRAGVPPDAVIVGLHVEAIARAALATDEATRLGDVVANELYSLVARRIGDSGARD